VQNGEIYFEILKAYIKSAFICQALVAYACNPNYLGDCIGRTAVPDQPRQNVPENRPHLNWKKLGINASQLWWEA
jgi:hypothetical protein